MSDLRQSTSITLRVGPFLDEDDGKTAETSLTINQANIRLSKAGGAFAQSNDSGGATHDESGWYYLTLDATDTNTPGMLDLAIHVSGALPVFKSFNVKVANVFDSEYSTDKLEVDVVQIGGDTQSATDLKDFADDGYDPSTNKVQGVATVDTLTGHTPQTGDSYTRLGAPIGASISADIQVVDGNVDSIKSTVDTNLDTTVSSRGTADPGDAMDLIADAVDSSSLATSAVDELVDAVWDEDATGHQGAGSFGETLGDSAATGISVHGRVTTALPNAAPAANGGVPTVDANNYVAGIQGTKNTLDDLNDLTAAQVNAEADTALSDIHLDHLLAVADSDTPVDNSIIAKLAAKGATADWSTFDNTSDSLEAIADGAATGDWSGTEKENIRHALGIDGTKTAPTGGYGRLGQPVDLGDGSGSLADMLTGIAGKTASAASYDRTADSLEAIRDRGDAAWTTGSGTGLSSLATGTAQGGAVGYITLAAGESATTDFYKGTRVLITGGTGAGQARFIKAYNGTSKQADVSPNWRTAPSSDSTYEIQAADANLEGIEQEVVVGNVATLSLKQLNIQNDGGSAIVAKATSAAGHGIEAQGVNNGHGIFADSTGGGNGIRAQGADSGMAGFYARGGSGGGAGIEAIAQSSESGIKATGANTKHGIEAVGGANGGNGIDAISSGGNGNGIKAEGVGTGHGLYTTANQSSGTGCGIYTYGGMSGGQGFRAVGVASHGMMCTSASGHGIFAQGGTSATDAGIMAQGNLNNAGIGMRIQGGAISNGTGGVGLKIEAGASASPPDCAGADAIQIVGADAAGTGNYNGGRGISVTGGARTGTGTDGSGIEVSGGGSSNGDAMKLTGTGTGKDLNATLDLSDTSGALPAGAFTNHPDVDLNADQSGVTIGTVNALGTQAKADVNAEVDTALSDYDGPTNAEMEARTLPSADYFDPAADTVALVTEVSQLGTQAKADVNAEVDTALTDIGLDHLLAAAVTGTDVVDNSVIAQMVSKSGTADWDSFDNTTDSLEAIRDNQAAGSGDWTTTEKENIRHCLGIDGTKTAPTGGYGRIGQCTDLGDGASLADMLTAMAGKTSGAGSYIRANDSLEAIRDRGDAAWLTGGGTGLSYLSSGTAQAGASGSITLAAGEPTTDDYYKGEKVLITGGTGAGQARTITGYTGSSKVATVSPDWKTTPSTDSTYEIQAAESNLGAILNEGVHGNNATLKLAQLDVQNASGSAIIAKATGGNGHGIEAQGEGTGDGIQAQGGGSAGHGIDALSGSGGNGIRAIGELEGILALCNGTGGLAGFRARGSDSGTNGPGIVAEAGTNGSGGAAGFYGDGGFSGDGIEAVGGTNGGNGIRGRSVAAGGSGIRGDGNGSGHGILGKGGQTGSGLRGEGGDTSGDGIVGIGATAGTGIIGYGAGNAAGIRGVGSGSASAGIHGVSSASGTAGIWGEGTGTGDGIRGSASGSNKCGIYATGAPGGAGIRGTGGSSDGAGIEGIGGSVNGAGIKCTGTGTGKDLAAAEIDALLTDANFRDLAFNRDVVTRFANQKPSQYTVGTGGNQETVNVTQDGNGNTETETKA